VLLRERRVVFVLLLRVRESVSDGKSNKVDVFRVGSVEGSVAPDNGSAHSRDIVSGVALAKDVEVLRGELALVLCKETLEEGVDVVTNAVLVVALGRTVRETGPDRLVDPYYGGVIVPAVGVEREAQVVLNDCEGTSKRGELSNSERTYNF
jgi:hypothetical protein